MFNVRFSFLLVLISIFCVYLVCVIWFYVFIFYPVYLLIVFIYLCFFPSSEWHWNGSLFVHVVVDLHCGCLLDYFISYHDDSWGFDYCVYWRVKKVSAADQLCCILSVQEETTTVIDVWRWSRSATSSFPREKPVCVTNCHQHQHGCSVKIQHFQPTSVCHQSC